MKQLILLCAILFALAFQAQASTLQTAQGRVIFSEGGYHLVTGDQSIQLSGLSHSQLRHYEDLTVKIAGERNENSMEIYKVFLKTKQGYETSYDWDLVNQDLYLD